MRTLARKLSLVLAFVISGGCAPSDPDVVYFVEHHEGGREWLESLPEKRQLDMFFASNERQPHSSRTAAGADAFKAKGS